MDKFDDKIFEYFFKLVEIPGVIVCKLVNKLVYKLIGTSRADLYYLKDDNELEYDSREQSIDLGRCIYLTVITFSIDNILGVGLLGVSKNCKDSNKVLSYFLLWIALSILAKSFSNIKILKGVWNYIKESETSITRKLLALPLLVILCLGKLLSYDIIGLAYAAALNFLFT